MDHHLAWLAGFHLRGWGEVSAPPPENCVMFTMIALFTIFALPCNISQVKLDSQMDSCLFQMGLNEIIGHGKSGDQPEYTLCKCLFMMDWHQVTCSQTSPKEITFSAAWPPTEVVIAVEAVFYARDSSAFFHKAKQVIYLRWRHLPRCKRFPTSSEVLQQNHFNCQVT